MGTMFANFHMCGIMFLLRAVLNMLARNSCPRGPMSSRGLMFSLSADYELLFLICFIASWTCVVVSVMLYHCIFCVALLIDLCVLYVACLTVYVNWFAKADSITVYICILMSFSSTILYNRFC